VTPEAPISKPDKIICIGLNYRSHAEEQGAEPPETPTFFAKFPNALVGDGATVKLPTGKVDYEAEVAFVIGKEARDVAVEDALDHIEGYLLLNDLSARDRQFATPQWMPGKVFDGSAPCGPRLTPRDEVGPPDGIGIELRLNGELRQQATTADLVHSIPELVTHLSSLMTLVPGDLVSTGSPAGVGSLRKPRSYLQPGDTAEISSPQLGTLTTHLA
jgi:2-keto-4-pentenoate hydratase/2-oxohepta-3-ene-1,7-dioic acid hydratase in catechol pathway